MGHPDPGDMGNGGGVGRIGVSTQAVKWRAPQPWSTPDYPDLEEVLGQVNARRALEIAAEALRYVEALGRRLLVTAATGAATAVPA